MPPKIFFYIFIFLAVLLEMAGDIFLKKWVGDNRNIVLIIGLAVYFLGTIFWALSLRHEYLSKAISIFTVLNLVVVALVGVLYFKEHLSCINKVGIVLGVLSVILLEL